MKQQLHEAILAGERALVALTDAEEKLNSAGRWGLFDLFGGGTIATIFKRTRMSEARELMDDAKSALLSFQRELRDVQLTLDFDIDDRYLTFTDIFLDNMFFDFLVQNKISKAQKQLSAAKRQIASIVRALKEKERTL